MIWALLPLAAAQDHAPGATLSDAITVNITRDGLDELGGVVGNFLPTDPIVLDPITLGSNDSFPACLVGYYLGVSNLSIDLAITDLQVIPSAGQLDLAIDLEISINSASDPFFFDYEALCISGDCDGNVAPFPLSVSMPMMLDIVPGPNGQNVLDATIGDIMLVNGLSGDDITLDNCAIGTIEDVLNFFGISLYDFVLGFVEDFLVTEIANQVGVIETTIEDAFSQASIQQSFELLPGVELSIAIEPSNLDLSPEGMALALDGSVSADLHECVAFIDPNSSRGTPGLPPAIGAEPPGSHLGIHVTDDFVNQAMYAVWRSGVLCQELEGEVGGFTLDTNLLGLLGGQRFNDLFPETAPIAITTVPLVPLEAAFGGAHAIDVPIEDLDIRVYAELDGRQARVLSVAISPEAGIDMDFDGTTGNLALDVILGDDYQPRISGDLVIPDSEEEILDSFTGILGTVVDSLVGGLLTDAASFEIPSLDGFGLLSMTITGEADEGIHATANVGTVPYTTAGCGGAGGGCAGGGCGGAGGGGAGCSTTGGASWAFLGLMTLLIRRRR